MLLPSPEHWHRTLANATAAIAKKIKVLACLILRREERKFICQTDVRNKPPRHHAVPLRANLKRKAKVSYLVCKWMVLKREKRKRVVIFEELEMIGRTECDRLAGNGSFIEENGEGAVI